MKKQYKAKKSKKNRQDQANRVLKTTQKIQEAQKLAGSVESLNKIISDTLYIQKGIAIDIKNFTLMSVPSANEIFGSKKGGFKI